MKVKKIGILSVLFLVANVYAQTEAYGDLSISRTSFSNLSVSEPKPALQDVAKDDFILKNNTKSDKSYATRIGTIKGLIGKQQSDITINKIAWTIRGNVSGRAVDIKIDNDNMIISGSIDKDVINIKFNWSVETIYMKGNVGFLPLEYNIAWKDGKLTGKYNGFPVKFNFDMKEAIAGENTVNINGVANDNEVNLTFNKISGELSGTMGNEPVNLKLVNCDLYDFIEYFFVFIR